MPETSDRLTEIRERWAKATPGPWFAERVGGHADPVSWHISDVVRWRGYTNALSFDEDEATCQAVAHAPDDIAHLIAEVERLRDIAAGLLEAPCGECGQ